MKLKSLAKICSTDRFRTNLLYVHVTRTDNTIACEATNGHVCARLIYNTEDLSPSDPSHQGIAQIKPGLYTTTDWVDLVCKGRPAEPIKAPSNNLSLTESRDTDYPDLDQIIPKGPCTGVPEIRISLAYIGSLRDIIGGQAAVKVSFTTNDGPIRFDSVTPDDATMVAIIMPLRV